MEYEVDGWLKQSQLALVRLIRLWGRVRVHTAGVFRDQGTQDEPPITTHTHTHTQVLKPLHVTNFPTLQSNVFLSTSLCRGGVGVAQ